MENELKQNNFYFQGKWFETSEEMFEYASKWRHLPLDQETAERMMDTFKKEIVMNVFLLGKPIKNQEFSDYLKVVFMYAMHKRDLL